MTDQAIAALAPSVGIKTACAAVGCPRAVYDRRHRTSPPPPPRVRSVPRPQPRALSAAELDQVRAALHSERFVDAAPPTVYATLLDEGQYLCSVATPRRRSLSIVLT